MKVIQTALSGVIVIEPKLFHDNRGFFLETYREEAYRKIGIDVRFVQDNHSLSKAKETVRGMHYQIEPKAQSKLVHVISGSVTNFVVDIREGSPTFLRWIKVHLTSENHLQLFIPCGFANGFVTEQDNTEVVYKVDREYAPDCDRVFAWDDPGVGIDWPVSSPILSERDRQAPLFADAENNFRFESVK